MDQFLPFSLEKIRHVRQFENIEQKARSLVRDHVECLDASPVRLKISHYYIKTYWTYIY